MYWIASGAHSPSCGSSTGRVVFGSLQARTGCGQRSAASRDPAALVTLLGLAVIPPHSVPKRHHAVSMGFDFRQTQRDVSVEPFKERDPVSDHDRHDRIANLVGEAATKTFGRDHAAAHDPDGAIHGPESPINELLEIA